MATPSRLPSLDGLRAISISLVLLEHLAGTRNFPLGLESLRRFGEWGGFGVRVFFIISGFLITSLLLDEQKARGRISLGGFYLRRAFRIFPAAYVFIAAVALLASLGFLRVEPGDFLHAVTYTMNFHDPKSAWVVHLWSLSVEEQFYFMWPAVLVVTGLRGAKWVALAQIAIAPVLRVVVWYKFPAHRNFQQFELLMDSIATGCLLALVRPWLLTVPAYAALLRSRWFYLVPAGVLLASIAAEHSFAAYMARDTLMNVGIAVCVHRFVTYPDNRPGRFLNWRPVAFVGTISYSLYLWQALFLNRESGSILAAFPANLAFAFTCALLSYYLVERPMLRLRGRVDGSAALLKRVRAAGIAR